MLAKSLILTGKQNDCVIVKKIFTSDFEPVPGIHDQRVLVVSVEIKIAAVEYFPVQKKTENKNKNSCRGLAPKRNPAEA